MEYTKDLILNVCYDEVKTARCFKTKNRTSRFWQRIQRHKMITASVLIVSSFIVVDGILIMNFVKVLEML